MQHKNIYMILKLYIESQQSCNISMFNLEQYLVMYVCWSSGPWARKFLVITKITNND